MTKRKIYQTPPGMHDILPNSQYTWQYIYKIAEDIVTFYNFGKIDTPILEYQELFEKSTGQDADVFLKEMYSLKTKGGDYLTLRPEGTPPVVRSFIQHGMHKLNSPTKLYYAGPMFRHERPQKGRLRQFNQFGIETIGEMDSTRDAEVIRIFCLILDKLKLRNYVVEVNSIGCSSCRARYLKLLKDYYRYRLKHLCADCKKRYKASPLKLLDCKNEKCTQLKVDVPQIVDYLCQACTEHFKKVLELLDFINVPYFLNPYLVRGLDYYTRTVFEIFEHDLSGQVEGAPKEEKRLAIASGGRYDNLVKFLGGKDTPAVGGAMGIERLLSILETREKQPKKPVQPRVFLVQLGDMAKKRGLALFEEFRKEEIPILESLGKDSISIQLKLANKFNVDLAIIIGQKEVIDKVAIIREMHTGSQESIPEEKLIKEIRKRLIKIKK